MHLQEFGQVGNGTLLLPALTAWPRKPNQQFYTVFGGPYAKRPTSMRGVVVAKELTNLAHDTALPIVDFKTPMHSSAREAVDKAVAMILRGERVYIGCMGGRGRTGLFLACIAKTFGIKAPVEYVREHYFQHAVETADQYAFVRDWQPSAKTQARIRFARFKNAFKKAGNLTRVKS